MSSRTDSIQPPRTAAWLVTLFGSGAYGESIPGDLFEEFSYLASEKGIGHARRWYWRQTVKSIPHLWVAEFRTAPWTITAAVAGAFLLRWIVSMLSQPAINGAIDTVLSRYRVYENDPQAYIFWLTSSVLPKLCTEHAAAER